MGSMSVPQITQEAVDLIFTQLSKMEMGLDENPLSFGPRRLNAKISQARGMLTECEGIFLQVSHQFQMCRSAHRSADVSLDLEKKNLFANDPEVRAGRNYNDRDAMASMKLRDKVEELSNLQAGLQDLETLVVVIRAKRSDLKDIQGRIRDQIKLCQEEIALGGRWGRKLSPGVNVPDLDAPQEEKTTLRDLQDLFASETLQPIVENQHSEESLEGVFSSNSQDADALLEEIEIVPRKASADIDDLLKDFDL